MSVDDTLNRWAYWSGEVERFRPLPDWAKFMLALGASVARLPNEVTNSVTAVAVPTRAYCAALAAAGYLIEREQLDAVNSTAAHLDALRALPPGTNVWVRRASGEKLVEGTLIAVDADYIRAKLGRDVYSTPIEVPFRVQQSSSDRSLKRSRRVQRIPLGEFAAAAFAPLANLESLESRSRVDVNIIGRKSEIESEITTTRFRVGPLELEQSGTLQDLIRLKGLSGRAGLVGFATNLETPHQKVNLENTYAGLAIIDGAKALIRNRNRAGHWIVVLDRCANGFVDGCSELNDLFYERKGELSRESLGYVPAGIEVSRFVR